MIKHVAKSALILPLLLGGCGLPPIVTAMTYAVDGLSYATSGKGMADHAISAATNKDCAMFRIAQGRTMCQNEKAVQETPVLAMVDTDTAPPPRRKVAQPAAQTASADGHLLYIGVQDRGGWEIDASLDVQNAPRADKHRDALISAEQPPIAVDIQNRQIGQTTLRDFPPSTELYAILQDDGTLEVFVHEPALGASASNLRLVASYLNFGKNREALGSFAINGRSYDINDLLV